MKLVDILVKVDYQVGEHPDSAMLGVIFRALNFVLRNYPDVEVPIIFEAKYLKTFTSMLGRIESAKSSENFPIANVHLLYCLTYLLLDELRIFTDIENNPIVEFLTWRVRLDGPHSQLLLQQELDVVKKTIENAKVVADYDSVRSYTVEVGKFESNLKNIVELNLEAKRLEDAMKKYRDAFNFAGLYQGFSQLRSRKTIEKNLRLIFLFFLGGLALTPLGLKLLSLHEAGLGEAKKEASWEQLTGLVSGNIELLLTLAALELLVIYFFRITLHSLKSLRAQLLQIDLRMTLCQFIDKYAEYSAQVKKNGGSLDGFESVVFSGLVTIDEKIPSTFDGLEFLQGVLSKAGGKAGGSSS